MVCLGRPYHIQFFKGCIPHILLGTFLNTLTHLMVHSNNTLLSNHLQRLRFCAEFMYFTTGTIKYFVNHISVPH